MSDNSPHIIVIGGANHDITGTAKAPLTKLADSHPGHIASYHGGVARNIAESLARLACDVALIAAFGDDMIGDEMKRHLALCGVSLDQALTAENQASDSYVSIHHPDGEMVTALNQMSLINKINEAYLSASLRPIKEADMIVIDANLSADALIYIASNKAPHQMICADAVSVVKAPRLAALLDNIDLLKATSAEAAALTGLADEAPIEILAQALLAHGVKMSIISNGKDGFWLTTKDVSLHQPALPLKGVGTLSGAGDGLLAGALFAITLSLPPASIALCAAKTAQSATLSPAPVYPELTREMVLDKE